MMLNWKMSEKIRLAQKEIDRNMKKTTERKKFFELTNSDKRKIREMMKNTGNDIPRVAKICGVTKHAVVLVTDGAWNE